MKGSEIMRVYLTFVPPGGGEADYSLPFDMPELPRPGDYISVCRPGQIGSEDFIVRRVRWALDFPETSAVSDNRVIGKLRDVYVEGEFAESPFSSEAHKRS